MVVTARTAGARYRNNAGYGLNGGRNRIVIDDPREVACHHIVKVYQRGLQRECRIVGGCDGHNVNSNAADKQLPVRIDVDDAVEKCLPWPQTGRRS